MALISITTNVFKDYSLGGSDGIPIFRGHWLLKFIKKIDVKASASSLQSFIGIQEWHYNKRKINILNAESLHDNFYVQSEMLFGNKIEHEPHEPVSKLCNCYG